MNQIKILGLLATLSFSLGLTAKANESARTDWSTACYANIDSAVDEALLIGERRAFEELISIGVCEQQYYTLEINIPFPLVQERWGELRHAQLWSYIREPVFIGCRGDILGFGCGETANVPLRTHVLELHYWTHRGTWICYYGLVSRYYDGIQTPMEEIVARANRRCDGIYR